MGKVINATSVEKDGIRFKSKLEARAYQILVSSGLSVNPSPESITLMSSFKPTIPFYKRKVKNWELDTSVVRAITYTPDFIVNHNGITYYIETKGFKTDSYNIKVKLFRKWLEGQSNVHFSEIRSMRELNKLIEFIKYGNQEDKSV